MHKRNLKQKNEITRTRIIKITQHMKMIKEFKTHVQITFCDVNDVDI